MFYNPIRTTLGAGDLGYIAYLYGKLYAEECGHKFDFQLSEEKRSTHFNKALTGLRFDLHL